MRTIPALLTPLAALALVATAAPALAGPTPVEVPPASAPRGEKPDHWLDPDRQVVHADGRAVRVTPRFGAPLKAVQRAGEGWVGIVAGTNRSRIVRIDADGAWRTLVADPSADGTYGELEHRFAVSPNGDRLAYTTYDDDGTHATVVRVSDGQVVGSVSGAQARVLDLHRGTVWLAWREDGPGPRTRLATWRPGSEVRQRGERLRDVAGVDASAGVAWRDLESVGDGRTVTVLPVAGDASWSAWRARGTRVLDVSPDGRHVLTWTERERDADTYPRPGDLVLRRTTDGRAVRVYTGAPRVVDVEVPLWESNRTVLAAVHESPRSARVALVRLGLGGRVEVVAPMRRDEDLRPSVVPVG